MEQLEEEARQSDPWLPHQHETPELGTSIGWPPGRLGPAPEAPPPQRVDPPPGHRVGPPPGQVD